MQIKIFLTPHTISCLVLNCPQLEDLMVQRIDHIVEIECELAMDVLAIPKRN